MFYVQFCVDKTTVRRKECLGATWCVTEKLRSEKVSIREVDISQGQTNCAYWLTLCNTLSVWAPNNNDQKKLWMEKLHVHLISDICPCKPLYYAYMHIAHAVSQKLQTPSWSLIIINCKLLHLTWFPNCQSCPRVGGACQPKWNSPPLRRGWHTDIDKLSARSHKSSTSTQLHNLPKLDFIP